MESEVIIFKVTKEQKEAVKQEARKLGLNMSSFLRLLIQQWSDGIRFERRDRNEDTTRSNTG